MTSRTTNVRALPWYREPWPWVLISLPGIAVIGCSITVWLAVRSADGIVTSDYYKEGLAINRELARTQRAAALGLHAAVELAGVNDGDRIRVRLASDRPLPVEPALRLGLIHPGHGGFDRTVMLARVSGDAEHAEYVGQFGEARATTHPVAWQVTLESPNWRLDGRMKPQDGHAVRLEATQ
ncbi:MAG: FixH family protein [Gemmatimonadota bacterium]